MLGHPLHNMSMSLILSKTRCILLPSCEDGIALRSFILAQYQHATDGQVDRNVIDNTALRRTVKTAIVSFLPILIYLRLYLATVHNLSLQSHHAIITPSFSTLSSSISPSFFPLISEMTNCV